MITQFENCMGCGGCEVICPAGAVSLKRNKQGFFQAEVDAARCIHCNLCDNICPQKRNDLKKPLVCFSYKSKSQDSLSNCASGGFAFDLSKQNIDEMPICSVTYSKEEQMPIHMVCKTADELLQCRNSIYLQSDTVRGFCEIVKQKKGIVFGTPCQISALHNILNQKKIRDQYILVDFFCHGVPSYHLWKKYMEKNKDLFEKHPSVKFRSKKNGWGSFTIEIDDGENQHYKDYRKDRDIFFKMFLENMVSNQCCYSCQYHNENSVADIRMGDFWGKRYQTDTQGVSAIIVYTQRGKDAIDSMTEGFFEPCEKEDILPSQMTEDLSIPSCRKKLLKSLSGKLPLHVIVLKDLAPYLIKRRLFSHGKNTEKS